jgi:hypothetical protein
MDLSYATIPVFGGEQRRLYREVRLAYLVSDHKNPTNHPIYVVEDNLGSSIFHMSDEMVEVSVRKTTTAVGDSEDNFIWKMYFDGACSKEGSGVGIVFIPLLRRWFLCHINLNLIPPITSMTMKPYC